MDPSLFWGETVGICMHFIQRHSLPVQVTFSPLGNGCLNTEKRERKKHIKRINKINSNRITGIDCNGNIFDDKYCLMPK